MTTIRKILTIGSLLAVFGFAQDDLWDLPEGNADSAAVKDTTIAPEQPAPADTVAKADTTSATVAKAPDRTTATTAAVDSTVTKDTTATDTVEQKPKKPRNKITYADYQARVRATAKKRSRTLHHGLTITDANYHEKRYGNMHHDADWGMGMGMYYFYRRYIGNYLGFQGRFGGIYRYSRWNFDESTTKGKLADGTTYTLTHEIDRKYHNFAADLPLTGKFGYHIEGTTVFHFLSGTFGLTKPIFEMVDTENTLYLKTNNGDLRNDLQTLTVEGKNDFPLYESHQTKKFFYMDDWETSGWIGTGIESRLISFEFQVFAIGASTTSSNHRYYRIGHDSNLTWRFLLDFSIR